MKKLKIAILEDDLEFRKALKNDLEKTGLVEILFNAGSSDEFYKAWNNLKANNTLPDFLILDIHLKDDSTNGLAIAKTCKLPVLFVSGEKSSYTNQVDFLKGDKDFPPVEEIGKMMELDSLKKILTDFTARVRAYQKTKKIKIKPKGSLEVEIDPSSVAFIFAHKGDHILYFIKEMKPITVADKSFDFFKENGFGEHIFFLFERNYLLNISHTKIQNKEKENPKSNAVELSVKYISDDGKEKIENLQIKRDISKLKGIFSS